VSRKKYSNFISLRVKPNLYHFTLQTYQEQILRYEDIISPITLTESEHSSTPSAPRLYMGSERMAQNSEQLLARGITHVVNCSAVSLSAYIRLMR